MNKGGQITAFIIMGLLLLFLTFILISRFNFSPEKEVVVPKLFDNVKITIDACLKQASQNAVFLFGQKGGIIESDIYSNYIYHGQYYDITLIDEFDGSYEFYEKQLEYSIKKQVMTCIYTDTLKTYGYELTMKEPEIDVTINPQNVAVYMDYEVTAKIQDSTTQFKYFSYTIPVKLGNILETAKSIDENTNYDDIDYNVIIIPVNQRTTVYILIDEQSSIGSSDFSFYFARQSIPNAVPILDPAPDFKITKGRMFEYKFNAIDEDLDSLTYSSSDNNIPINSDGSINHVFNDVGRFVTEIVVTDSKGAKDSMEISFVVE